MRDYVFFPLAFLLAAGLVLIALQPGFGALPTGPVTGDGKDYSRIDIKGPYLNKVIAGPPALYQLIEDSDGQRLLQVTAPEEGLSEDPLQGPHFRLAADIETQFSGMLVRVTVRARKATQNGAEKVALNYSAGRLGESGWREFDLTPVFQDFSFEYRVPVLQGDPGNDYLGVRPLAKQAGEPASAVIESIVLQRLHPW